MSVLLPVIIMTRGLFYYYLRNITDKTVAYIDMVQNYNIKTYDKDKEL